MENHPKTRNDRQSRQDESCKKRLEDLERERERRKREQKLNNKRVVYVKKTTALRLEKKFRQYPKQKLSEIVERLLKYCLKDVDTTTSENQNNLRQNSGLLGDDNETIMAPEN